MSGVEKVKENGKNGASEKQLKYIGYLRSKISSEKFKGALKNAGLKENVKLSELTSEEASLLIDQLQELFPQEEKKWKKIVDLIHFNKETEQYKSLRVMETDNNKIVLVLREGITNKEQKQITFQLSEQEICYLALKLTKLV
ncbi:hypothetical protein DRN75_03840 [Nanoarchaeota archaeon]|nr:MAG: hypothetical protein DRN75_03840 [Nanoarchaeota archaeon]